MISPTIAHGKQLVFKDRSIGFYESSLDSLSHWSEQARLMPSHMASGTSVRLLHHLRSVFDLSLEDVSRAGPSDESQPPLLHDVARNAMLCGHQLGIEDS